MLAAADEAVAYKFSFPINDDAYAKATGSLPQPRIDPKTVGSSPFPTWGLTIASVTPGSEADKMGLTVDSVIARLNGEEYFHHKLGLNPDAGGKRVLSVISPQGVPHDYDLKPGKNGFSAGNSYRYEQYIYQNTPRGKWDRDLLVASVAWQAGNHPLAEAALQRAGDAGLPSSVFTRYFGALLALDHGDLDLSHKLLSALLKDLPADRGKISRFFYPGLSTLALAYQDFDLLAACVAEREGLTRELQQASIVPWKAWAKAGPHESLYQKAVANAGQNLIPGVTKVKAQWVYDPNDLDLEPLKKDNFGNWIPMGHYDFHAFEPAGSIKDAIWEIQFACGDGGELERTGYESINSLKFVVCDRAGTSARAKRSPRDRDARAIAGFTYIRSANGERLVRLTGGPTGEDIDTQSFVPLLSNSQLDAAKANRNSGKPLIDPADSHFSKLTMIRIGNEAEILLNERSIFHIPIDPEVKDLAFFVFSQGTSYFIDHMSLRPIVVVDLDLGTGDGLEKK
jgi:hypothetical protein